MRCFSKRRRWKYSLFLCFSSPSLLPLPVELIHPPPPNPPSLLLLSYSHTLSVSHPVPPSRSLTSLSSPGTSMCFSLIEMHFNVVQISFLQLQPKLATYVSVCPCMFACMCMCACVCVKKFPRLKVKALYVPIHFSIVSTDASSLPQIYIFSTALITFAGLECFSSPLLAGRIHLATLYGFEFWSVPLRDDSAWQLIRERDGSQEGQEGYRDMFQLSTACLPLSWSDRALFC